MKLLLVDDEQTFLNYLAKRLTLYGYDVKTTFSGEGAVDAASKEDFDVALVDLEMPGMDGIDVQRQLEDLQPDLPCIILTDQKYDQSLLKGQDVKDIQFMSKPLDMGLLTEAIKEAHAMPKEKPKVSAPSAHGQKNNNQESGLLTRLMRNLHRLYAVEE